MKHIYGGPPANLGRFCLVATGQILDLNEQEAAVVADDSDYAVLPVRVPEILTAIETGTTLTNSDSGKEFSCKNTDPITITLPASPKIGCWFGFRMRTSCTVYATANTTLGRNGHFIDGEANDLVLVPFGGGQGGMLSVGLYWNGATWRTF